MVKEITVQELNQLKQEGTDFKLIDVRELHEVDIATIGGELIPLGSVVENLDAFNTKIDKVIVYCRSGKRSASAIDLIQNETGQQNLYNLKGGILQWADEIDNSITKY